MNTEKQEEVKENGQVTLRENGSHIHLLSIIGEIEGHECAPASAKTTKYEHVLPQLAAIEDDPDIEGLLILINTVGGDISAGLALAEMIASLSCPTVSLVLGDSHSIGVPLAVSTDYSLIVPTGTMIIHPVRMTGMVIGAPQTYDYFKLMQERILSFIAGHCPDAQGEAGGHDAEHRHADQGFGHHSGGGRGGGAGAHRPGGRHRRAFEKLHALIDKQKN